MSKQEFINKMAEKYAVPQYDRLQECDYILESLHNTGNEFATQPEPEIKQVISSWLTDVLNRTATIAEDAGCNYSSGEHLLQALEDHGFSLTANLIGRSDKIKDFNELHYLNRMHFIKHWL